MKKILKAALLSLLFAGLIACSDDKMDFYKGTESVDLSGEKAGTVAIGAQKNEVVEAFGKPESVDQTEKPLAIYYEYGKNSFRFGKDGTLTEYTIGDQSIAAAKGIRIGDSRQQVIDTYGNNFYERNNSGYKTIGYFDKGAHLIIEFTLQAKKVITIQVSAVVEEK